MITYLTLIVLENHLTISYICSKRYCEQTTVFDTLLLLHSWYNVLDFACKGFLQFVFGSSINFIVQ